MNRYPGHPLRPRHLVLGLVAALAASGCESAAPSSPVRHHGADRVVDLGELELTLDPSTNARFVRVAELRQDRTTTFHERDAEGGWAKVEVHRFPIDAAAARALQAEPDRLRGQYLPDRALRRASAPDGTPLWVTELSHPEGMHEEDGPSGRAMIQDPPRYHWTAAAIAPGAVLVVIYLADLAQPEDAALDLEAVLREGRRRHGARAATLLGRLRASGSRRAHR